MCGCRADSESPRKTTMKWHRYKLLWLARLLRQLTGVLQAGEIEVVLVKSSDNAYFNQSIVTLMNSVERRKRYP